MTRYGGTGLSPWNWSSALLLLALLACAGVAGHAESDPLTPDPLVEAVQRKLVERGYDPGTIDGLMGWRTRDAIRKFQRSAGLLDTGEIDDAALVALGLDPPGSAPVEAEGGTPQAEPAPIPGTGASKAEASNAGPATEAGATALGTGVSGTEAPRTEPAPVRPARRGLSFAALGWHRPQTGAEALARFDALGLPRDFRRGSGTLFVPKADLVFVLRAGEQIPGLDCDPGAGRLSIEFVFEPDGPIIFTPVSGGEYCQMGIGIAIEVGHSLEMRRIDWGDVQYPRGTVRITNQGLEYVR